MKISELMLDPKFDLDKYIEDLQKENQQLKEMQCPFLGTGCKRELEQLKKQKDDVVEYIQNTDDFDIEIFDESTGGCLGYDLSKGAKNILRMLGEIDND